MHETLASGVDNEPVNMVSKGAFIMDQDSVLAKIAVENCPPFTSEVGTTRDVLPQRSGVQ